MRAAARAKVPRRTLAAVAAAAVATAASAAGVGRRQRQAAGEPAAQCEAGPTEGAGAQRASRLRARRRAQRARKTAAKRAGKAAAMAVDLCEEEVAAAPPGAGGAPGQPAPAASGSSAGPGPTPSRARPGERPTAPLGYGGVVPPEPAPAPCSTASPSVPGSALPHAVFLAAAGAAPPGTPTTSTTSTRRQREGGAAASSAPAAASFAGMRFPQADLPRFGERFGVSVVEATALLAGQGVHVEGDGGAPGGWGTEGARSPG